jgi:hypothetical protein
MITQTLMLSNTVGVQLQGFHDLNYEFAGGRIDGSEGGITLYVLGHIVFSVEIILVGEIKSALSAMNVEFRLECVVVEAPDLDKFIDRFVPIHDFPNAIGHQKFGTVLDLYLQFDGGVLAEIVSLKGLRNASSGMFDK